MNNVETIQQLAALIDTNDFKVYPVRSLLNRFANVEDQFRYDQVIRNVQRVLEKKAFDRADAIISAEELSKIANEFATLGSVENFKNVFADVLPETMTSKDDSSEKASAMRHTYFDEGARSLDASSNVGMEVSEDEPLTLDVPEVYADLFSKADRKYGYLAAPELVRRGQYLAEDELRNAGHSTKVKFALSNEDTLLYTATLSTDYGRKQIFVPVEMQQGQVLYPAVFATDKKIYELSKFGMDQFLNEMKISFFESQMKTAGSHRDTFFSNTIREMKRAAGLEVDENTTLENKVALPTELADLGAMLENIGLQQSSKYTRDQITAATKVVSDEIGKCGYNSKTAFAGDGEDGINVAAIVEAPEGKIEIIVPVPVTASGLLFPSKFVVATKEIPLSKVALKTYISSNQAQLTPVRYSSEMISLDFNSLRRIVHSATTQKDYTTAEQALNVISDKYGEENHMKALADYQAWLLGGSLDFKDNFGLGARSSIGEKEPGWEGAIMTSQIKLT